MAIDMDRITTRVAGIIPVSWDAMSGDKRVDDSVLVGPIEYAETLFLGEVPGKEIQEALDLLVVEFVAKHAVLSLVSPAIDYWMEKADSVTLNGPNETTTYPDKIRALEKLRETLTKELAKLEPIVAPLIPVIRTRRGSSAPRMNTIADDLLTPSPQDFGPAYGEKVG